MTFANRGKAAEAAVKKYLKSIDAVDTIHYRYPDFRAGFKSPAPCDFMVLRQGKLTLLEVKSVEHAYRLPHKNMSPDQVARMRMWACAGAESWVLVQFTTGWRAESVEHFLVRDGGSWDMSLIEPRPLVAVMKEILC